MPGHNEARYHQKIHLRSAGLNSRPLRSDLQRGPPLPTPGALKDVNSVFVHIRFIRSYSRVVSHSLSSVTLLNTPYSAVEHLISCHSCCGAFFCCRYSELFFPQRLPHAPRDIGSVVLLPIGRQVEECRRMYQGLRLQACLQSIGPSMTEANSSQLLLSPVGLRGRASQEGGQKRELAAGPIRGNKHGGLSGKRFHGKDIPF